MGIRPSIRCSNPSSSRGSSSISKMSRQHDLSSSLASSSYLILAQQIHRHNWFRAVTWLLKRRCRLVVMMRRPVPSCPVRFAACRWYQTGLRCRPRMRRGCHDGCEDKGNDFETHICCRIARSRSRDLRLSMRWIKAKLLEFTIARNARLLNKSAMRHAAALIFYRIIRKPSTRRNMF